VTAPGDSPAGGPWGEAYVELLAPIWSYLVVSQPPVEADVVFAFGCGSLLVPQRAANLHLDGWAPTVLVSGAAGRRARELFDATEAAVFARHLRWLGVPDAAIVSEDRAANTGENVALGMLALEREGIAVRRALLVAKPFGMRRCAATFRLRHPRVETVCCPPAGALPQFVERARPAFAARLLAELERLALYPALGYIAAEPHPLPPAVTEAAAEVRRRLGEAQEAKAAAVTSLAGSTSP
jgi:hypothetical protein